jgi:FkbM family methyltransferase
VLYQLKRFLLKPYVWYQRLGNKDRAPMGIQILEVYSYSPAIKRFFRDSARLQLLFKHNLNADSIVFDVGGFRGEWAEKIIDRYDSHVHIFEVMPRFIEQIEEKYQDNEKITVHPFGLFNANCSQELSVKGPGSSLFNATTADGRQAQTVTVALRDIKEVMDEIAVERVDLLKINIEGAEFPLLKRMIETNLFEHFNDIMIQYHEFAPNPHWQRYMINRALKKTHKRVWNYPFVWEKWSRNN